MKSEAGGDLTVRIRATGGSKDAGHSPRSAWRLIPPEWAKAAAAVVATLPPQLLDAAREYVSRNRVHSPIPSGPSIIDVMVQGGRMEPYEVSLTLARGEGVAGSCSCEFTGVCKHRAAVLVLLSEAGGRPRSLNSSSWWQQQWEAWKPPSQAPPHQRVPTAPPPNKNAAAWAWQAAPHQGMAAAPARLPNDEDSGQQQNKERQDWALAFSANAPPGARLDPYGAPCRAQVPMWGRKRSLLIGINYTGQKGELSGCWNDVQTMRSFLHRNGWPSDPESQVVLTDDKRGAYCPTKENIIAGMRWLVSDAQPGDCFFLHFSGHGGQVPDLDGDECDGFDETLFPVDHERSGQIVDDEIFELLVKPLPKCCKLTAFYDCCHSGTVMDLPYVYVATEQSFRSRSLPQMKMTDPPPLRTRSLGGDSPKPLRASVGEVVMFSGCSDSQKSADVDNVNLAFAPSQRETVGLQFPGVQLPQQQSMSGGACTAAFVSVLLRHKNLSFVELLEEIRVLLKRKSFPQIPQLSSSIPLDLSQTFSLDHLLSAQDGDERKEELLNVHPDLVAAQQPDQPQSVASPDFRVNVSIPGGGGLAAIVTHDQPSEPGLQPRPSQGSADYSHPQMHVDYGQVPPLQGSRPPSPAQEYGMYANVPQPYASRPPSPPLPLHASRPPSPPVQGSAGKVFTVQQMTAATPPAQGLPTPSLPPAHQSSASLPQLPSFPHQAGVPQKRLSAVPHQSDSSLSQMPSAPKQYGYNKQPYNQPGHYQPARHSWPAQQSDQGMGPWQPANNQMGPPLNTHVSPSPSPPPEQRWGAWRPVPQQQWQGGWKQPDARWNGGWQQPPYGGGNQWTQQ
eukprot:TRINITY_DN1005_c0_g1_i2.p1 TRINITY_DN1005_c0_g1~~TRINITY_DN1005_c0_g1_i2.p1  ORF type:complete len:843 (+),score=236.36 TRINITY_DN1005_c0_g1_i2:113-2641(+)